MSDDEAISNPFDGFAISEDLVQSRTQKQAGTGEVDFDGLLQTPLKLHEDLAKGNGGQAWPAGRVLAKYLLRKKRDELKRSTMLAIALGCQPDQALHVTDMDSMLKLMQQNIALNELQGKVQAEVYNWGGAKPDTVPAHPDVVLAADCVYFEPAFPLLQQTLEELIGPNTTCYFCFKKRRRADMQFMKAIKKTMLVEDVADDPDKDVCVIRRKQCQ
ncbi:S-adenosyl-L-methionine-dependent methyltransferase [Hortaea werneckii]|nr:S-adenosyl-L-methionine-dependent methyltransferase [Hortaea werneckii]KAI7106830.1 S-adenosyl-L-methionine-dependent methyltransferase [Hortaea werneckii]KAI7245371.1 S-adenosyl-L-methionine-dependent methyltransferase [Hortaea werneckii]KAI7337436.1 S-adenosyl-L-methionine-dependent methyltransferase [Hortaea werneckii]KAI7393386.1 S-adenosyl-L-methionine-dependent methyltransferase [Hortaea werneckii]